MGWIGIGMEWQGVCFLFASILIQQSTLLYSTTLQSITTTCQTKAELAKIFFPLPLSLPSFPSPVKSPSFPSLFLTAGLP